MFIQTEETPNPQTLKFVPGVPVLEHGTVHFPSAAAAARSPLAEALFGIEHVVGVFLGTDFISVTKSPVIEWPLLKAEVLATIMEHFVAGKPVLLTTPDTLAFPEENNDNPIVQQIKELIETRVRPAVAQDGGDIVYRDFKDGVVYLELRGACSGCPSSSLTLKRGIENMLIHYIPEVQAVEAVA